MGENIEYIFVIESLPEGEIQSGETLYNDIIVRSIEYHKKEKELVHLFIKVSCKQEFIKTLEDILTKSKEFPNRLLLHLETHGNKEGLELADKSFITFKELIELLRPINIATSNKLYITLAACYGRYLYSAVEPNCKSPYKAYISASKEVYVDEILEDFSLFFETLIEIGDIVEAYLKVNEKVSNFYYKDSKQTFEDGMLVVRKMMYYDSAFRDFIVGGNIFKQAIELGIANEQMLTELMELGFYDIYNRHKSAFEF